MRSGTIVSFIACSVVLATACAADPRLDSARAAARSSLPSDVAQATLARIEASPARFLSLLDQALKDGSADSFLLRRVDKAKALPDGYAPSDLVSLDGTGLSVSREGHRLRRPAYLALKAMDAAARADGVTLLVSSAYRSYAYQVGVWDRGVKAEGEAATAASIAPPGRSQHQLGMAIDFGSIDDSFAETRASRWLVANAGRYGFSLSYPKGLDTVTGYKWESWHYRYIGAASCSLQAEYFGGIQQYLMLFLEAMGDRE
jgi:D-alanyl-D-alanine carboxypeptidase